MGIFDVALKTFDLGIPMIRVTVTLTPGELLLVPPQPWNVYPLDADDNPLKTKGAVLAAQRGSAAGVLYFTVTKPRVGSFLYFQNLTALNDYCERTHTTPNTVVGKSWPGLGFTIPPTDKIPLLKGTPYGVCDAFLCYSPQIPPNPQKAAQLFLEMLAGVYTELPRPQTRAHDWPAMARASARDLSHSRKCHVIEQGYLYLHPYVSAEYPDSMVQLAVLLPLMEYADWLGSKIPLVDRLRKGVPNFFDPDLGTIRRYLATVGDDKEPLEVDSWYLYHPLTNLARLAKRGDDEAKELFLKSVKFGIKVARHFKYVWPVQYHLRTLDILTDNRKPGEGGQTDVAGIYAYVMLQAWDITAEKEYLTEAKRAIQSLKPLGFTIGYQFNLVALGVTACIRLWKITADHFYLDEADVLVASFFHNTNIWDCEFGPAKFFPTFMGVTCLHDGPYMAAYEEFEAFEAFHECLALAGDDLRRPVRLLMTEYIRYAHDRCWFYYPSEFPSDQLSKKVRNGEIDRELAIPLEDLYADWQEPGAVGQEVYGSGLAFKLLSRSHHRIKEVPFVIYCDYPLSEMAVEEKQVYFRIIGDPNMTCRLRLIKTGRKLPGVTVTDRVTSKRLQLMNRAAGGEYELRGNMSVVIKWD